MTVYVDDMRRLARVGRTTGRWSHLFADDTPELMAFAARLGLNPTWVQHPGTHREHFDITDPKRDLALKLGAKPITYFQTGELMRRRRPPV